MFALDTNTLIYFFKGVRKVSNTLLSVPPREIAIPAVVLYELEVGIAKSTKATQRRRQLDALTSLVSILHFHGAAARRSAEIRAALESAGTPIGPMDTLIAGTALSHGAILVTHNTAEFSRVGGLQLQDWC
jgi:tRNA(fMet)-specific endonuclease VapC